MNHRSVRVILAALLAVAAPVFSQPPGGDDGKDATIVSLQAEIRRLQTQQGQQGQQIRKDIDDWMWFSRMSDIARVDKVRFTSPKPAAGRKFDYKIYDNAPGGHYFNRIDTPLARESRKDVLAFLGKHLK